MSVAILGGTGRFGRALAGRWSGLGLEIFIGSRETERAVEAAKKAGADGGFSNADAAARADIVVAAVPAAEIESLKDLAGQLDGKVVISPIVPVEFVGGKIRFSEMKMGSAAETVASVIPNSKVVSCFHTVSFMLLGDDAEPLNQDVLVCGDDGEAKQRVIELAGRIDGLRPVDGGPLFLARASESMGVQMMMLDRMNNANCGISVTGLPQ